MKDKYSSAKRDWSKVRRIKSAHQVSFRVSEKERAQLKAITDRAGITISGYVKSAAFNRPIPKAARRPDVDSVALRQVLGQLGKIGSNANQIARAINAGNLSDFRQAQQALDEITAHLRVMRAKLLDALEV